ncbi:MAG: GNAT family N-acetyltransferase [Chloroflexia bacterium]
MHATSNRQATFNYTIDIVTESDLPALVAFFNECDRLEHLEEGMTLVELTEWFHNPVNKSKYLMARLANEGSAELPAGDNQGTGSEGGVIGCVEFELKPLHDSAEGWLQVHPHYRNAGVGRALYAEFERRATEAGVAYMRIGANSNAHLAIEFLERRGFALERYFWSMRLPTETPVGPPDLPPGITARTFVPGQDEELWTHVRNATFAEHYGSVPRTVEEMSHFSRQEHFRPEGLFFAFDGDRIAGFCSTRIDPHEQERLGISIGHINTLGVMPAYRGRGIGRGLLLIGVDYLRRFVSVVGLGVEGKNERALALYEGVGFRRHKGWAIMEKKLSGL